jgi:phage FluMu protein Com
VSTCGRVILTAWLELEAPSGPSDIALGLAQRLDHADELARMGLVRLRRSGARNRRRLDRLPGAQGGSSSAASRCCNKDLAQVAQRSRMNCGKCPRCEPLDELQRLAATARGRCR